MSDLSPYRDIDYDAMAADEDAYLEANPKQQERMLSLMRSRTTLLKAVGGPFDGMDLNVPPGGSEVALPAAYGDGDMKGLVIYRRGYDAETQQTVMVYAGQPEQIPDEEDNVSA